MTLTTTLVHNLTEKQLNFSCEVKAVLVCVHISVADLVRTGMNVQGATIKIATM